MTLGTEGTDNISAAGLGSILRSLWTFEETSGAVTLNGVKVAMVGLALSELAADAGAACDCGGSSLLSPAAGLFAAAAVVAG